ncbi:MAG: peptidoglycan-binding protein [Coriobacteriales bacterium]|jgi:peptidoglycan hydrolase-like protein with peptidoglycan-binding domain|nr:peptidoglycan-binding protein [Coriobacteriales bacterium]
MDNQAIRELQTALSALGFDCLINGELDQATRLAIEDFQRNERLAVSGEPDDETIAAIERLRHAWEGKDTRT